jgi:hypothetical protein
VLASWLNVEVKADLSNALLIISADRKLPFELAEERKARAGKVRPVPKPSTSPACPKRAIPIKCSGARLRLTSWRQSAPPATSAAGRRLDARYEIYASGEVAGASFDARLSSDDRGVPENLRIARIPHRS